MIAADDDNIEPRQPSLRLHKETIPESLRLRRRIGAVEDVAADEKRVDGFDLKRIEKP